MRRTLSAIILGSMTLLLSACDFSRQEGSKDEKPSDVEIDTLQADASVITELSKAPLPCSKEALSAAWKRISISDKRKGHALDYGQHTPTLFLCTDLDGDSYPEVLMRGEPPYAAIFSFRNDSLQLITCVRQPETSIGITPEGVIVLNGSERGGAFVSRFIRLKNSAEDVAGESRETFLIREKAIVSGGTKYQLKKDSAMTQASREEYMAVAPHQNATFLEDIEGWEDVRLP